MVSETGQGIPDSARTKRELVAHGLRQAILRGELQRGQHLTEIALAAKFNVSPTPVREALRSLQAEGLVTLLPHKGGMVTLLSAEEIREVFEMRVTLEAMAAKHAAESISADDVAQLKQLLIQLDFAKDDPFKFFQLNSEFHSIINKACGRKRLLEVIYNLRNVTQYYFWPATIIPKLLALWQAQHHEMVDALEQKNGDKAELAMRQHLSDAAKAVEDYLQRLSVWNGARYIDNR